MKILAVDIGTGTQDILLFNSEAAIENSIQMVMPAPTVIAANRVHSVTQMGKPLILKGTNMGGGPVTTAVTDHIAAGFPVYATPKSATTFDDDLDVVNNMGIIVVPEEEIGLLDGIEVILSDLDLPMIERALTSFEVSPTWDALAVSVFDHGNAPPGYSDRKFRFDHLKQQISINQGDVLSFIYLRNEIPDYMTRMRSVADTVEKTYPLIIMDSAEAAILGSLEDNRVASEHCKLVSNIGNEHTLAFHLHGNNIVGILEHHTHVLSRNLLEERLVQLAQGNIDNDTVWNEQGHGSIVICGDEKINFLSVIGPMRNLLSGSVLNPYFATPHGSMMLAGSFGLIRACAQRLPSYRDQILDSLKSDLNR